MGLAVSAIAPNSDRATSFIPIILIPQVIFSGVIFKTDGIAQILAGFFASRWAIVGMGSSIGLNGDQIDGKFICIQRYNQSSFTILVHVSPHVHSSWLCHRIFSQTKRCEDEIGVCSIVSKKMKPIFVNYPKLIIF